MLLSILCWTAAPTGSSEWWCGACVVAELDDAFICVVVGTCLGLGAVPACMALTVAVCVATRRTWADNVSGGAAVGCGAVVCGGGGGGGRSGGGSGGGGGGSGGSGGSGGRWWWW